jgi:hypothetical protein
LSDTTVRSTKTLGNTVSQAVTWLGSYAWGWKMVPHVVERRDPQVAVET